MVQENGLNTNKNTNLGGTLTVAGTTTLNGNVVLASGKTITGGGISIIDATTTTVLTAAQSGSLVLWDAAAGFTITLPAPAVGLSFSFGVATSVTSSNHKLITDAGTTFLYGGLAMGEAAGTTTLTALGNGTSHVAVTMNGTTTGGLIGTFFNVYCTSATKWVVEGLVAGSGTLATPFATS